MFKLPRRIDELLPSGAVEKVLDVVHRPDLYQGVKDAIGKVGGKEINPLEKMQNAWQQTRLWLDSLSSSDPAAQSSQQIINATGQLFCDQFGSPPTAPIVAFAFAKAASSYRDKAKSQARAEAIARKCTEAEHSCWLTSVWAAVSVFVKSTPVDSIVIARSDALRIGSFGDVGKMLEQLGLPIAEVGASNGAAAEEWTVALQSKTQLLVIVSPNGLGREQAAQQRSEALAAAKAVGAASLEIAADGVLSQTLASDHGFPAVSQRLHAGVSAIVIPTHFLLAGPVGALLASNRKEAAACPVLASQLGVAMQGAELSMAASAAQLHCTPDATESGAAALLAVNPDNLKNRASRLALQLKGIGSITHAEELQRQGQLGPTIWSGYQFPTWVVAVQADDAKQLRERLAQGMPYGIAVAPTANGFEIDLRFVPAELDHEIVRAFSGDDETTSASQGEEATGAAASE